MVAMAFVTIADGVHYVHPIVVAAEYKRTGWAVTPYACCSTHWRTQASPRSVRRSPRATLRLSACSSDSASRVEDGGADRSSRSAPTAALEDSKTDRANPGPATDRSDRLATSPAQ